VGLPMDDLDVEIAPGADLASDPSTWTWVNLCAASTDYPNGRVQRPVSITGIGRNGEGGTSGPSRCEFTARNEDGALSAMNPTGPWYPQLGLGTPLRVMRGASERFFGLISELPTLWLNTLDNSRSRIVADGIARRLSQGEQPLDSPLRRWVPRSTDYVAAYWPMEDGGGDFASGLQGGRPMLADGEIDYASLDKVGSKPLPTIGLAASIRATIPAFTPVANGWRVDWLFRWPEGDPPATNRHMIDVSATSPQAARWVVRMSATELSVQVYDTNGDVFSGFPHTTALHPSMIGSWLQMALRVVLSGTSVSYEVTATLLDPPDATPVELHSMSNVIGGTGQAVGRPTMINMPNFSQPRALGHVVVSKSATADPFDFIAANGFASEHAGQRLIRLCLEEGVPLSVVGDEADTMPMGPQSVDTFTNILRECEAADGGILTEHRNGFWYRTRVDMQNQDSAWDIDFCDLDGAPSPTHDDQQTRNDVTAARPAGSSARAVDEDHVARHGRYEESLTVNVDSDQRLEHIASWHKGLGTVEEMRWPSIPLEINTEREHLLTPWQALELGDRITIPHDAPQLPGVEIDLLVEGWSETFYSRRSQMVLNARPASPWNNIFTLDDADLGRMAFRAYLAEAVDTNDTSFDIVIPVRRAMNRSSDFEQDFITTTSLNGIDDWRITNLTSFARSNTQTFRGLSSGRAIPDGTHTDGQIQGYSLTGSGQAAYAASVQLLAPAGGLEAQLMLRYRTSSLVLIGSGTHTFLTAFTTIDASDWTRLYISGATHALTGSVEISVQFRRADLGTLQATDVLYVDEAEVGRQGGGLATSGVFPVDFMIGGELVTVSAIGAMTNGIQTLTVTRSVNGIVKSHPAGTDVVLHPLPRLGLGN
jgi:hypothetical protein